VKKLRLKSNLWLNVLPNETYMTNNSLGISAIVDFLVFNFIKQKQSNKFNGCDI